ncbi:hypothetical protein [Aquabacterium sp. OR-4]|uniref:hypothetical protein n=1 Tax=Aquabacterium sp. OR-4 TaxID=2978127 RepID=UPI0021B330A9|nr:hypothetical protein [Aquabacterium sp. OR-4]MDT7838222.1 hypothetical protein [Aquabacterium sp. OR-4]
MHQLLEFERVNTTLGPMRTPPRSREPTVANIAFVALLVFAAMFFVVGVILVPEVMRGAEIARHLAAGSGQVDGAIVGLQHYVSRQRCETAATVLYRVDGRSYEVVAHGCGRQHGRTLKLGDQARVTFALADPRFANAVAPGVSSIAPAWPTLPLLWALAAACGWGALRLFRRGHWPIGHVPQRRS